MNQYHVNTVTTAGTGEFGPRTNILRPCALNLHSIEAGDGDEALERAWEEHAQQLDSSAPPHWKDHFEATYRHRNG